MPFFEFDQNNSGGSFDDDMGYKLFVEAASPEEANARAESVGVYFYGCDDGRDCECCGDRWTMVWGMPDAKNRRDLLSLVERSLEYASRWKMPVTILFSGDTELTKVIGTTDLRLIESQH